VTHLDTTFVVDLLRESARHRRGPATERLETLAGEELGVGVPVVCELLAGAESMTAPPTERARVQRFCQALQVVYPDERFAPVYGRLFAVLDRAGQRIGVMDLLIATSAVVDGARLVTRNAEEFSRVPGLEVLSY
jgi:predicted nucleic acid-binding protein